MNHFVTGALLVLGVACAAHSQEAPIPKLHEGDKWVHIVKTEEMPQGSSSRQWASEILRTSSFGLLISNKPVDSNMPPQEKLLDQDWSEYATVDGKKTAVKKLFHFPLFAGKTWERSTSRENPSDKVKLGKSDWRYKVLDWEDVKVPAGTFKALKIEVIGDWYIEFKPTNAIAGSVVESGAAGSRVSIQTKNSTTPAPQAGKFYQAIWYSPEVKREVKFIDETYNHLNVLLKRTTNELESFAVKP